MEEEETPLFEAAAGNEVTGRPVAVQAQLTGAVVPPAGASSGT